MLADFLKTIDAWNEARINELWKAVAGQLSESVDLIQASQSSQLQQLLSHGIKLQLEAPPTAPTSLPTPVPPLLLMQVATESHYTSAQSSPRSSNQPSPAPSSQPQPQPHQHLWEQDDPPAYRMCHATKMVEGLWQEWTIGLRGQPSITALDGRWGSRWRSGRQSELQWYSLRLEVIKEIRRTAQAQRISEEAAMLLVNMQQRQIGCSLDRLCKQLRQGRRMARRAS
jgi:transcriptional activator of glycolytic enzymes GCR1